MSALKNLVFSDIRSDYLENGNNSFLYRYLRNGKLKEKCDKDPQKEEALIHKAATDLMYNQGYPLAKPDVIMDDKTDYAMMTDGISDKEAEKREKQRKKQINKENAEPGKDNGKEDKKVKPRFHNTLLDLIEAWYDESNGAPKVFISISDYQSMYDELNIAGNTTAFIPVRIDRLTGAGLYIMGRDNYPAGSFPYPPNQSCGLCILSDWKKEKEGAGVSLNFGQFFNKDLGPCNSVDKALVFFDYYLRNNSCELLTEIQDFNGNMLPNTPAGLKMYFADYYEEDDFEVITERDSIEAREDYKGIGI